MSILTTRDRLDSINDDLEVSKSLKISLMKIANDQSRSQKSRNLAITLLEKERIYEQKHLALRREIQKTIRSGRDIRPGELPGNYEGEV